MDLWSRREGNASFTASYLYKVAYSALVDEIRRVRREGRRTDPEEDVSWEPRAKIRKGAP
jgi:DNA-directed RNA polymerase specialized sigma24 family protein